MLTITTNCDDVFYIHSFDTNYLHLKLIQNAIFVIANILKKYLKK